MVRQCLWTEDTDGPIVHPSHDKWAWRPKVDLHRQTDRQTDRRETLRTRRTTCATLFIINLTWIDRDANRGLRGYKLATNGLSYGMDFGEMINSCQILVGNPERKRPVRRPWCRWKDIKSELWEIHSVKMWAGFNWLNLAFSSGF
jgi:hypothetical protein